MISSQDRVVLRDLAKRVAEIAALPEMMARIAEWQRHNSLRPGRPMILVFPEGAWSELMPATSFQCETEATRAIEWDLRHRIYLYEHFQSDNVITGDWEVARAISNSGWGFERKTHASSEARGAWGFQQQITGPADLNKLRYPEVTVDDAETERRVTIAHDLFGDLLSIRIRGIARVGFSLMNLYTGWRGLEQVMLDMYEEPQMLHDAMAFLEAGYHRLIRQYQELNLLCYNNDNTYQNSGGNGYTTELPLPDADPSHVRPCDMWACAEAQEMAQVSPEQHEEFILQYERRLLAPFGLNGYGCCEDLTRKLDRVFTIPNLRRISISPWANVDACAEKLQDRYLFSWKPNPSYLASAYDPEFLRGYIQHTLDVTKNCRLEIILKDTHTCNNHPERFDKWVSLARSLVNQVSV